jgi:hypothetical protein
LFDLVFGFMEMFDDRYMPRRNSMFFILMSSHLCKFLLCNYVFISYWMPRVSESVQLELR